MAPVQSKLAPAAPRTTRSGREFSAFLPEVIHAPVDYAVLMRHAVEVYENLDTPERGRGFLHSDEPPPSASPRSPSPPQKSVVFVMPLDDLVSEIATAEASSSTGAGSKRPAQSSDSEGDSDAHSTKKRKKRAKTAEQKKKRKESSNRRKKAAKAAWAASGELPRRRQADAKHGVKVDIEQPARKASAHAFCVDRWGYGAVNGGSEKSTPWLAQDLDNEGVRYIPWDGATTKVILDSKRRVVAVLLARPQEPPGPDGKTSWDHAMERLAALFERIRREHAGEWKGEDHNGRRGQFTSFGFGSSYGGGQSLPGVLRKEGWEAEVERELRGHPDLQRLARWGSEGFASFFPKAYAFADEIMRQLFARGEATRNMPGSVYAASTCNLGPRTVCLDHTDHLNYPGIPCVITGFGSYNADEGGDLFLLNFGLRIRFPPGSTAILSSAGVRHGNTPVPEGQTRYSYTQYTAGGLVRWVSLGFRKAGDMKDAYRSRVYGPPGSDWNEQLSRLSVYEGLLKDREALAAKYNT